MHGVKKYFFSFEGNYLTSENKMKDDKTKTRNHDHRQEVKDIHKQLTMGTSGISSILCPLDMTRAGTPVAAIAEHMAKRFWLVLSL